LIEKTFVSVRSSESTNTSLRFAVETDALTAHELWHILAVAYTLCPVSPCDVDP